MMKCFLFLIAISQVHWQLCVIKTLQRKSSQPNRLLTHNVLHQLNLQNNSIVWECIIRLWHEWATLMGGSNPKNWIWKIDNDELVTIMFDVNAAPDILFKNVHCNCKTGWCGVHWSYRTNGLERSSMYSLYQFTHCENQESHELEEL